MTTEGARVREGIINIIKDFNGKPCPSNELMARILSSDPRRISEFLHALVQDKVLEKHGAQLRRAFSVVATGEKTTPRSFGPLRQLPKHCNENLARAERIKAMKLPAHVWYGGRDASGNPIEDNGR